MAPPPAPALSLTSEGDDLPARVSQAEALAAACDTLDALAAAQERFDGIELKKGAACLLDLEQIAPGAATLLWALTPRQLRLVRT